MTDEAIAEIVTELQARLAALEEVVEQFMTPGPQGRPQKLTSEEAAELVRRVENGESVHDVAEDFSVAVITVYRYLARARS